MSSILKSFLKAPPLPPSAKEMGREINPTPLAERITQAAGIYPESRVYLDDEGCVIGQHKGVPEHALHPQTIHHIEHLERQAELAVLQEAGHSDLAEDYEGLSEEDVPAWVERVLLPAYGLAVAKLRGVALGALLILSALPIQAGDEWGRERTRDRSRESTDWSDSRESRQSSDWSSDWGGGGTIPPSVPEPGSAAGLLVVAGAALVLRRQVGRRGR
jgi:hypothetical protein